MAINKKFIIAHLHVADKNNKGDLAIVLAVQELLRKQFINCRIIDIPVDVLKNGGSIYLKKINSADFVVIGGGGIFYSYFLPYNTDFIKKIKKPIIIVIKVNIKLTIKTNKLLLIIDASEKNMKTIVVSSTAEITKTINATEVSIAKNCFAEILMFALYR